MTWVPYLQTPLIKKYFLDSINQEVLSFQVNEKCTSVVNGGRGAGQG